jgi:hypothetical protein
METVGDDEASSRASGGSPAAEDVVEEPGGFDVQVLSASTQRILSGHLHELFPVLRGEMEILEEDTNGLGVSVDGRPPPQSSWGWSYTTLLLEDWLVAEERSLTSIRRVRVDLARDLERDDLPPALRSELRQWQEAVAASEQQSASTLEQLKSSLLMSRQRDQDVGMWLPVERTLEYGYYQVEFFITGE